MKKNIFKKGIVLLKIAVIFFILSVPFFPAIAEITEYELLSPLPGLEETFSLGGSDTAGAGDLGVYLNVIIPLFIGICIILAVIMIVLGGLQYMTSELVSSKEAGKEKIRNAIFGLLLALGAWLILYTINPNILKTDLSSLEQQTVEVNIQDSTPQPPPPPGENYPNSNYKQNDPWDDSIGVIQNIPGVSKNYSECIYVGQSSCLSTRNLNLSYINQIKAACPGVTLQLNGGTEFWHHGGSTHRTTHGPGSPTIDLQSNSALNSCLSGLPSGQQPVKYKRYGPGNLYYYEGGHWHIGG